ncbi:MAG: cysteine--tRNA ligase [Candidatus Norongarragalinales archaeon]
MVFKLYNTLTRKKQVFETLSPGVANIYTCGPTVYQYAHIGNFRAYVCQDLLRRWLEYRGWRVKQVQNLTDVDDKTIAGALKEKIPLARYTKRFADAFFEDIAALRIERAEHYPRATETISEIVALVQKLVEKGFAYKSGDGSVYFAVHKFKDYGKLSKMSLKGLKEGARVAQDSYDKEHAADFALWKAWTPQDGDVAWDAPAPLGRGRPGWHAECSAMALKFFGGETLDVHAGGVDLIFPHHENEIAQSEAATGKQFARFWFHNEHLLVDGRKMSKSLGNYYTLRDVLAKGYSPLAVRYLLLSAHYRQQLNFTFPALDAARAAVERYNECLRNLRDYKPPLGVKPNEEFTEKIKDARKRFEKALDDDLDAPSALATVFDFVRDANAALASKTLGPEQATLALALFDDFEKIVALREEKKASAELAAWVEAKLLEREAARKRRDFARADELRKEIQARGVIVEDAVEKDGKPKWRLK